MKPKKFEKIEVVSLIVGILLLAELLLVLNCKRIKITSYHQIPMIITDERKGTILVKEKERKQIYQNKVFYYKNQKIEYEIVEDNKKEIHLQWNKKMKKGNVVMLTIKNKRVNIIEMIKNTWGGDKNR